MESNSVTVYTSVAAVAVLLAVQLWWRHVHLKFERDYGKATYRVPFQPLTALGVVFGSGLEFTWDQRFTLYRKIARELISLEPRYWGKPMLYTNSSEVMRQISATAPWGKPQWSQSASGFWGRNLLTSNGVEWKKHRKIVQPSFNSQTYEMVWSETTRLFNEMIVADQWPVFPGESKRVGHAQTFTQRVALCVILSCGFGIPLSWSDKTNAGDSDFGLDEGIKYHGDNATLIGHAPSWLFYLPFKRFQYIRRGTEGMRSWFSTSITNKKTEISKVLEETNGDITDASFKRDVFSRLVLASQVDSNLHLSDSEITGNTWVLFFAGHDTTAKVLAAALCLLAAHKEEQAVMVDEIKSIVKETSEGTLDFDHYGLLVKTKSVFVEALRMYPAGSILLRETSEDTSLQVPCGTDADGTVVSEVVPVPKGTLIMGDMVGMQYNPRSFPQPESFRPSRWYSATTDEAYTAFSGGPRACVGRRFALVEGVCFLANMLRYFEVDPLLEKGETVDEWKERVLDKTEMKMTLGISASPLVFKRRSE